MQVAVSFLKSQEPTDSTIKKLDQTNCDYIHVDVMDGIFVPQKTEEIHKYLQNTEKKLDVHLMCANPEEYFPFYQNLNTEYITIQIEINQDISKLIEKIKSLNIKVGIAINPETDINIILPYLKEIDQVLVMSVHPGLGGQKFMPEVIPKIQKLTNIKKEQQLNFIINVDGGINADTISLVKQAGVDMAVSGSFVCMSENYQVQIDKLR